MIENFNGRTAIISGASRGIGFSVLKKFAENKCDIFAFSSKINKNLLTDIEQISKEYNVNVDYKEIDISNRKQVKDFISELVEKKININYLINNAGILNNSLVQMTKYDDLKNMFEINYFGQFFLTQQVIKIMIKSKGTKSIVNLGSTSAEENDFGRFSYNSSKAAFLSFSKTLFKEVSSYGIKVNSISPGLTETTLMKENTKATHLEDAIRKISLKRIAHPDEIANVVLFLCSDLSSYINGQNIRVDGGMV